MLFSKSFGYSLRGILYIASQKDERSLIRVDEVSAKLKLPRHYMGKILKRLARANVLLSIKGPSGGFSLQPHTLSLPLLTIYEITKDISSFNDCAVHLNECNEQRPCPLHNEMFKVKEAILSHLKTTTIRDLLTGEKEELIKSISNL